MAYRDDVVKQLRSELKDVTERLEKFEKLYADRGFSKTFGRKVVEGFWQLITWPFRTIWAILKSPVTWGVVVALSVFVGGGYLWRENDIRDQNEAAVQREHDVEQARRQREREESQREEAAAAEQAAADEAAAAEQAEEDARQAEANAARQALLDQCTSFCRAHGYTFHDNRRDNMCFCTTGESERTTFIINVNTAENWTVRSGRGQR